MDNLEDSNNQLDGSTYTGASFEEICVATFAAISVFCIGGGLAWCINGMIQQILKN